MTTAQQRLHHALDALDSAGTARPGPPVHGCEHCWTAEEFTLLAGPPALLPDRLLQSAAAKSADLWDDFPALYRRLTPVVLRKLTTGRSIVEGWVVGTRLATAGWRDWPEAELIGDVLDAWWAATLDRPAPSPGVLETLETAAVATGTITPWLRAWADTATRTADRHLADAVDGWLHDRLTDLRFGLHGELEVGSELTAWLLALPTERIGADRRKSLECLNALHDAAT
ncbi:hypothetical protein ACFV1L_29840 [Kitasatospora sp. NPDC059646]|uniref:hypothetical protein n=1 Tax=Kitasatospora sp. NPDC059646 TaxID=3346893 RepID=UPI00367F5B7D